MQIARERKSTFTNSSVFGIFLLLNILLAQLSVCQYCSSPNLSSDKVGLCLNKDPKTLVEKTHIIMIWVINQLYVHLVYCGYHDIHFLK